MRIGELGQATGVDVAFMRRFVLWVNGRIS